MVYLSSKDAFYILGDGAEGSAILLMSLMIAAKLGQLWDYFLEKTVYPANRTSKEPICGYTTYLLVLESMYLFSAILKGTRWAGTMFPMTSKVGR